MSRPPTTSNEPPEDDDPTTPVTSLGEPPARAFRIWFYGYVVLFAVGVAVVSAGEGVTTAAILTGLFLYMSLANTFCPLPTTGMMLYAGSAVSVPGVPAWASIGLMTTLCALGTTVANVNEYFLVSVVFRSRRVARLRDMRVYRAAARWFERRPFPLILGMNVLPLPIDVVRWLAIAHRYPLFRYAGAIFAGRWIRYGALLWLGRTLDLPLWGILAAIGALGLVGLARTWILRRAGASRGS